MSSLRRSMSIPLVPLKKEKKYEIIRTIVYTYFSHKHLSRTINKMYSYKIRRKINC